MGDTYTNLGIGRYNRRALASIDKVVDSMLVATIAEPIDCADVADSYGKACITMRQKGFDVLGVRSSGRVVGYVPLAGCNCDPGTPCSSAMSACAPSSDQLVVEPSFKLFSALQELGQRQRLFVSRGKSDDVVGIVTRADLQKATVRMMVFAYMTVFEIHLTQRIREHYPNDSWQDMFDGPLSASPSEIQDYNRRLSLGEESDRLDCLSLFKKTEIARLTPSVSSGLAVPSVDTDAVLQTVSRLRNAVAHGSSLANRLRRWADVAALVRDVREINLHFETGDNGASPSSKRRKPNA